MNKTRTRDLLVASAIVAIVLLAAIYFGAFERYTAWVQEYGAWQIGALSLISIALVTVLTLYYWRKHGRLEGEVAERRRIEETLRQQRDLYEGMLTAQSELGEGLVVIEDERIRYANDAFCQISGYCAEELKALPGFMELVAEDERAAILEHQRRRREGEEVKSHFDTALQRKDGRRVDIEIASKILETDGRFRSIAIVRDVTWRKVAEARLREAEERYRTLVENIAAVTYIQEIGEAGSGRTGSTMYASPQIEAQSGYPPEAFVKDPELWIKILHPEDRERVLAEDERTDETGEPFSVEYRQIARDGRTVWIRDEAVLVRDEEDRPRFWHGVQLDITERKEAEQRLQEAEARYRALVEQIPAITYIQETGETSHSTYVSPQMETMLGYTPEECISDPEHWVKVLHPLDRERVLAEDRRTNETGEPFSMEYRQFAKDGRMVWIKDEATLVRDEEGNPLYWLGIMLDITEQKLAQEALRQSELRLRTVTANVPVVLFALDYAGVITLSEGKGLGALGLAPGEIVGRSISEVFGDKPEILKDVDRALAGEELSAVREVNSRTFEMWYSPLKARTGEIIGVIGVTADITERERAEQALREAQELFRSAFDNAPIGITVSDLDGRYLRVNRALCDILGYPEEELLATTFQDLTYPEDLETSMAYADRLVAGEIDKYSLEKRYVRADGSPVWVSLSVSLMRDPDNRPLYYVAQVQDITERKRAEERLREVNRRLEELAALRADFTAMVAHEIGSPLAAIRGYLDVLETGELEPAEQAEIIAKIQSETDRLSTLIADVKNAAAIERDDFAITPRETSTGELLKDASRFAETLPGDHPLVVEDGTQKRVLADQYRVGQVLRNLLSNAAKYSPDGAPIELRAVPADSPGRVRIEVADKGYGVDPADVRRIFEKFGRGQAGSGRRAYGIGLGLYLSRRIVQAHGADLTLDSRPGGGSVFGFELEVV